MDLYFFTEARFDRVGDTIWTTPGFSMILWERYLTKFDRVYVVGRVCNSSVHSRDNFVELCSDKVTVVDLPYYIGLWGYLKNRRKIKRIIDKVISKGNAYLARVPGNIGSLAAQCLKQRDIPYALEIVGDPWESMSKQAYGSVLSPLLQRISRHQLLHLAKDASAALYVTNHILQNKYPVGNGVFSTGASNVVLNDDCFADEPKRLAARKETLPVKLLSVGTLSQLYKAPDVILKAVAVLKNMGYQIYLTWYGDGQYKEPMKLLASKLGISESVNFAGAVPQSVIREEFDRTALFVHASRAEGLPRAVIEAMAWGLPCIGSSVAGIPELLDEKAIVRPNDAKGLARKIADFLDNPSLMDEQARKNWLEAKKYHNDILTERRNVFYDEIIRISAK